MKVGGDAVVDAAISHPDFPARERAPRRNNFALIAVLLAVRPQTAHQNKSCSDWANLLQEALLAGVLAKDFADWSSGISIKECKMEARKRRRAEKTHPDSEKTNCSSIELNKNSDVISPIFSQIKSVLPTSRLEISLLCGEEKETTHSFELSSAAHEKVLKILKKQLEIWDVEEAFNAISHAIRGANAELGLSDEYNF